MNLINILTGPIKSGKTTRLTNWIQLQNNCAGILAPVQHGLRFLHSIHSKQNKQLEIKNIPVVGDRVLRVGKYCFDKEVFDWAQAELLLAVKQKPDWLIIDEIGPLEIAGIGLEPAVSKIINKLNSYEQMRLLLVIRKPLLDTFFNSYRINEDEVRYIQI